MTAEKLHRISLQLTEAQQRQILEATGLDAQLLVVETRARVLRCAFAGLPIDVSRGVFSPQPASERLARVALELADGTRAPVLVEVGTGSGAIGLALAAARPDADVHSTEVSPVALRCARRNRRRLGIRNVRYHTGSLTEPLPARLGGRVSVVVANLPYVPPDVSEWDPWPEGTAIGPGVDGLDLYRALAHQAQDLLRPGGWVAFQMGDYQWEAFAGELTAMGYEVSHASPAQARDRANVGSARWPGSNVERGRVALAAAS